MLSLRTRRGPVTGSLKTPVKTVRPCQATSLGRPTLTDTNVPADSGIVGQVCRAAATGGGPQSARTPGAGAPATSVRAGTSLVTTAPAATTASSPTVTPCRTVAPAAIRAPRRRWTGAVVILVRRVPGSSG